MHLSDIKMVLNDREYRYWLTKNCERHNCWVVVAKLGEMLLHKETTYTGPSGPVDSIPLHHDALKYVYLAHFEEDRVTTIVQDDQYYYLIDNQKTKTATVAEPRAEPESGADAEQEQKEYDLYTSDIKFHTDIKGLISMMSGGQRKRLKIQLSKKAKLKAKDVSALNGVTYIDFINKTHEEQVELWKTYMKQQKDHIDLSGFFLLEPQVLIDAGVKGSQDQIIINQNNRFYNFEWLKLFPKLKVLSIWYVNMLQDEHVGQIAKTAPNLNTLELHNCYQVTGRALIPLFGMHLMEKLIFNNEKCSLQESGLETVITDEEWMQINNASLNILLIDSHNLTLDFIDLVLKRITGLKHFIMNEIILEKLRKNSASGCDDDREPVTFHSASNLQSGFKRYRHVKVYDQVRNKCGNMFSDAMLKIIAERNPERAEVAEQMKNTKRITVDYAE